MFRLKETTGITADYQANKKGPDGELFLDWNGTKLQTPIQVKKEIRAYQLEAIGQLAVQYHPLTIVAENIFPEIKKTLREKKIGYLDAAGNIFLPHPRHLLWIDGNKPAQKEKPVGNRAFTKAGLRTVFYLLLNKDALDLPHRELARITGVALGNITNIIAGLKDAGFILQLDQKRIRLQNKKALLERWMVAYHEKLKPDLHIGDYKFWTDEKFATRHNMHDNAPGMVYGGETAAEILTQYLTPGIITLYTPERLNGEWMSHWGLVPAPGGEIRIYKKFWTEEQDKNYHDPKQPVAPPLLVYADLMMTGDPRCIEAANLIYEQYLRGELE
ncbi:MAG TPA: type IV toxin-antitoxin system AbiEi family antitoxin [Puia sp.]|nr:type IV toxin-antitoxin system AbiEi family antitoxin [Puia sp.]